MALSKQDSESAKLVYKYNGDKLEINHKCLECLSGQYYLTDTIVQFYTAYLINEVCNKKVAHRIHIFDSYFHQQLVKIFENKINRDKLTKVRKWFSKVDIFEKDYLIFPICSQEHWFAIVVCNPNNVKAIGQKDTDDKNPPGIIVMDSLNLNSKLITLRIRDFLDFEWRSRGEDIRQFSHHNLSEYYPSLPKQTNAYDCGIYMLMYLKTFVEDPDEFYRLVRSEKQECREALDSRVRENINQCDRQSLKNLINDTCIRSSTK